MEVQEQIWKAIADMDTPGFFVTAEMERVGTTLPEGLTGFVREKMERINQGATARKFTFTEGEWRMYITFFPTDRVVDERYALKNKVMIRNRKR